MQDTVDRLAGRIVGSPEYEADRRGNDHRFAELAADVEDLRRQHAEDIRAVKGEITADREHREANKHSWRNALWVGALPALVAAVGVIVSLWIAHSGGH